MIQSVDELLGQLRPVTAPLPAPPREPFRWMPWLVAGAIATLAFAIFMGIRWSRRQDSPHSEALKALRKLPKAPSLSALTDYDVILRRYLERRYGVPAHVMTPAEFNGEIKCEWRELLQSLQVQRFAPVQSMPEEWSRLIRQLELLIQGDCEGGADQLRAIKSSQRNDRNTH